MQSFVEIRMVECLRDVDSLPWVHFQHAFHEINTNGAQVVVLARFLLELGESRLFYDCGYLEVGKFDDFLPLLNPWSAALP